MTEEQQFFLQILSDHLNGRTTEATVSPDWNTVYEISNLHQLSAIVYQQCSKIIPQEHLFSFERAYLTQVSDFANRRRALTEVQSLFLSENIPYLIFKGMEIADLYPYPALRSMGDCDILVKPEDRDRAGKALETIGFSFHGKDHMEWHYTRGGVRLELHDRLFYRESVNTKESILFGESAWRNAALQTTGKHTTRYSLNAAYHYVYLLLHLKKHFLNSGVGFRQFLDLALLYRAAGDEKEEISKFLSQTGLTRFSEVCLSFCDRWFFGGCDHDLYDNTFFQDSTQTIFKNGVFGFTNEENADAELLNTLRASGKFKSLVTYLFPPYRNFCVVSHYSFIKGKPFLLPAAWIYRFYRLIRYRKENDVKVHTKELVGSDRKVSEREKILETWGC